MNIEKTLTDELRAVGAAVLPPPPPEPAQLIRHAEQVRLRTRLRSGATVVLAAAVVLAIIVLGTHLNNPKASPSPLPQPTQTPTTFAVGDPLRTWDGNGQLHLDGVTVAGNNWAGAVTSGDLTTVQQGPYDTGETGVFLGSKLVGMIRQVADHEIPVAPDHRTIAWVVFGTEVRTKGAIVVGRVSADGIQELGRLQVDGLVTSGKVEARDRLLSVAVDGTVLYGGKTGGHSWKPGAQPVPADISGFLSGGPNGFPSSALDLQLSPTRTWASWPTDVAYLDETDGEPLYYRSIAFQRVDEPDWRVKISFADQYDYVNVVAWESDTDLIVYASDRGEGATGRYLRCNVVDRSCEYAAEP